MVSILYRIATWPWMLSFFVVTVIMGALVFPFYQKKIEAAAGEKVQILDVRSGYNKNEVKTLFDKLSEQGRQTYKSVVAGADMIFPLAYGLLFISLLAWLGRKAGLKKAPWLMISLVPVLGMTLDYAENVNTLRLLNDYPRLQDRLVAVASMTTQLKHIFLFIALGLIGVLLIIWLFRIVYRKSARRDANPQ